MSQQLISHSPDLKQLRDDGYDVEVRFGRLLIKNVPYVNSRREIAYGILISELTLAGDVTTKPSTHVAHFSGEHPCYRDGSEILQIKHQSRDEVIAEGLVSNHSFSSKPPSGYQDYYEKITTYVAIISSQAQAIDPNVTAKSFPVIDAAGEKSVFAYLDTASSRAGINGTTRKLEGGRVAIIGLGGTGSYVLDLISKTPVIEIHLFDGDTFSQHNAFRSPGAASLEQLTEKPKKAAYFQKEYSKMHNCIFAHNDFITASNVDQLKGMTFVFLCLDSGASRKSISEKLIEWSIPFVDVGMGVDVVGDTLGGVLRVTICTPDQYQHLGKRLPFSDGDANNDYARNIQVADLNALNAALAVIKWKKHLGFYRDLEREYHSTYTIDGNQLTNDDQL